MLWQLLTESKKEHVATGTAAGGSLDVAMLNQIYNLEGVLRMMGRERGSRVT